MLAGGDTECCGTASCRAGLLIWSSIWWLPLPCGYSPQVLLEIQDTLKQPPQAAKTMKKAMNVAITGAFAFYLSVAVTGYAALGVNAEDMPGEVLEGFTGEGGLPLASAIAIMVPCGMLSCPGASGIQKA